ncbi:MAG: PIN domain-containing protein [Patescibacteria group bacterium]|nr:PIN domain-containing protein [Patescibacteria group bacterium]
MDSIKLKKRDLIEAIGGILDFKNLKIIDDFDFRKAIEIYEKYPVKFIDALIASNSKIFKKELTIVSYDKDFDKLDVRRKEPKKVLKEI